jgi:hypothetical protein
VNLIILDTQYITQNVRNQVLVKEQIKSCLNPICKKKFTKPILISNYSINPPDHYHGCPFCFSKIDPIIEQKIDTKESLIKNRFETEKVVSESLHESCPHYFGYLSQHYKDAIISMECLSCLKMSDCILKYKKETK